MARPRPRPLVRPMRPVRTLAAAGVVATLVLAVSGRAGSSPNGGWAALAAAVATVLLGGALLAAADRLEVGVTLLGRRWCLHGIDAALPLMLVLAPSPWLVAAALVAAMAAPAHGRRRTWRGSEFGVLSAVTAVALAVCSALLAAPLVGGIAAAVLGGTAAALTREAMSAAAVAATARRPVLSLLRPRIAPAVLQSLAVGGFGVLVGWLARHEPTGLTGMVVPAVLVVATLEVQRQRDAEARLYASLAAEQERLGGRSADESAGVLLVTTARLLGGADVELLLVGPEGLVRYRGDESGVAGRATTPADALDDPRLLSLLSGDGVRSWHEGAGSRPVIGFAVGMRGSSAFSPVAVAVARRPVGAAAFGLQDVRVARALAAQAGPWLTPGHPAGFASPGDRQPAVAQDARRTRQFIVREAAMRLTAAAQAQELDPDRLAEELRLVQRAVAALVGERRRGRNVTRHVSARSDWSGSHQDGDGDGSREARRGTDWTTTGLLPEPAPGDAAPLASLVANAVEPAVVEPAVVA